jgi:glycosyltransferase 2 family protein
VASLSGQIMPGGVGAELARIGMGRSTGMEWSKLVSLAVMDRLLLVMALIVTVACGLAVVSPALRPPIMLGVIASSLAVSAGMIWLASGKSTPKFAETLLASVRSVLGGASLRPILLLRAAAIALFGPANMALAAWFLANAMQIPLSIGVAVIWIPLVLAAAAVPVSLGGWGVREAAAVALLGQAGIPASEAVALSVGIGIAALIAALPGAFMVPISLRTPSPPR